jgi:hypothetical protein
VCLFSFSSKFCCWTEEDLLCDCDSVGESSGGEFEQEFGSVAERPMKRRGETRKNRTEKRSEILSESPARSEKSHTEVKLNSFIKQSVRYPNTRGRDNFQKTTNQGSPGTKIDTHDRVGL